MSVESLTSHQPLVLILMGTFNGEKYIREQLDSIASQTYQNWRLVISDDGSTDRTLEAAQVWAGEIGADRVEFRSGPQKGFAQNFLSMACDSSLKADFYAFCDQDDVWKKDKLEASLRCLTFTDSKHEPHLYCGRTQYVNDRLETLGCSPLFLKPPGFKNALVQSLAGGNTMVFNQALKHALETVGTVPTVSHDWWVYQLASGMNARIQYDPRTFVLYRQHAAALIGGNTGIFSKLKRLKMAIGGEFRRYTDHTIACLENARGLLHQLNNQTLDVFKSLRSASFFGRVLGYRRLGLYRQTILGQIGLIVFGALNKI